MPKAKQAKNAKKAKRAKRAEKKFRLRAGQIKPLATGRGACIATDMITVRGMKVDFMYREEPHDDWDSGWVFMAGNESQRYVDDPDHWGIYDVNTIANYDPEIVPLLDACAGSAFERHCQSGRFVTASFPTERG
jgi:hypothetical protein